MVKPEEVEVKCPKCGKVFCTTLFGSISSDWPNAAQLIISRDLWKTTCPKCGKNNYVEHPLMYTDLKRNLWIQR